MRLKILVIECNSLTALTTNSIKQNMPNWEYEVVPYDGGFIRTALTNTSEVTLCVMSGVILNIQDGDLPKLSVLENYDICLGREGVFTDNSQNKHIYRLVGDRTDKKTLDMSVFIITPKRWVVIPPTDSGVLAHVKRLRMPRHMNHKTDPLVEKAISAKIALEYGMLGLNASVHNYVPVLQKGTVNCNEMFAYCLELCLPLLDGLPELEKQKVKALAERVSTRVSKLRNGLSANLPLNGEQ